MEYTGHIQYIVPAALQAKKQTKYLQHISLFEYFSLNSISGPVYGITGRPVRLSCGYAIIDGEERLWWKHKMFDTISGFGLEVAGGVYMNRTLANEIYVKNKRAELSTNGSLIIHSYEDGDAGNYSCRSIYRSAESVLITSGGYIVYCSYIDGTLPKGPYPPRLRMADRTLLRGYPRYDEFA